MIIELARLPIETDLGPFSDWLSANGIAHRVVESDGEQVLILADPSFEEQVRDALKRYLEDPELKTELEQFNARRAAMGLNNAPTRSVPYDRVTPTQAPLVFVVIGLCVLVAWLTGLGEGGQVLRSLLIIDPFQVAQQLNTTEARWGALVETLRAGEVWRLFTPDLLHFSVLHITFNLMMFWILGGQLEHRRGSLALFILILVVSIASNIAQLLDGGYLFGGLSGVVYGLFGYCWVWSRFDTRVFMPTALFRFALIWLVIGYTPFTESLGLGRMANSAHLYGLLSGLIWAWCVFSIADKRHVRSNSENG